MSKVLILFFSLLLLLPPTVYAEEGRIEIREFSLNTVGNNLYRVNARVNVNLSGELRNALLNGVKIFVTLRINLGKHNIWWWDTFEKVSELSYELKYHSLSKHYIVTNRHTNQYWNFSNLPRALQHIAVVNEFALPQFNNRILDGQHYLYSKAVVIPESPNLPLKIQSYLNTQYRLESEGVLWALP